MFNLIAKNKLDRYDKHRRIIVVGEEESIFNLYFYLADTQFEIEIKNLEDGLLYNPKNGFPMQPFRDEEEIRKFYG